MGEEKKASFYDNIPDNSPYRKDPKNTNWYPLWMKVLSMLDDNEAFVDFGCGTGQFAELAFKANKNYVMGMDFSTKRLGLAIHRNLKHADRFMLADLTDPDTYTDIEYDTALFCEVMEHIKDDLTVIGYIETGKRIIITLPSWDARAHVRHFKSIDEIRNRYSSAIHIINTITLPVQTKKFFIIDGVRL